MRKPRFRLLLPIFLATMMFSLKVWGQTSSLSGYVESAGKRLPFASVLIHELQRGAVADSLGHYHFGKLPVGNYRITVSAIGYMPVAQRVVINERQAATRHFDLPPDDTMLDEIVITGTMKEVSKLESPVPVEVYRASFFKANPTPTVFDALQNINGVRPQLNCNICNTGDIHINGLEGPYTMVLIDGMPIVSGLSTIYGLSGIPQSLIQRVEIVKGPASTLYGSEAVGGLINIITRQPEGAPLIAADAFTTSWGEVSANLSTKFSVGKKVQSLAGLDYFNFQRRVDNNDDNFTDVTLQHRLSAFTKWHVERSQNRIFSVAARYVYEDRWGGELNWSPRFRGGSDVYGESIYTRRWEIFGTYQLPIEEKVIVQFSTNGHLQNSAYGKTLFNADQYIAFGQITWTKMTGRHDFLTGLTYRYTYYDDDTPVTMGLIGKNSPAQTHLPGLFLQDEIAVSASSKLLLGIRYDHNSIHGSIVTPRVNFKWSTPDKAVVRLSVGNGYRVANVFTEDHAALTGARRVEFISSLKPETSWNGNVNYVKTFATRQGSIIGVDASAFYTYFTNKIIANYDTDPNSILFDNLSGYAVSRGAAINVDVTTGMGLKLLVGGTYMDVFSKERDIRTRQLFTEQFTGVWNVSVPIQRLGLVIDYTGNLYSPMRLPRVSEYDPRREYSPWWSIQNIQISRKLTKDLEIYGGVKNLLNWTPNRGNPFLIARANDPFDKQVTFDSNGKAMLTPENPYGLTFDPTYVYAPNQGIRIFAGMRYSLPPKGR